jgi:hypothetical protein
MLLADRFYYLHNFQRVLDSVAGRYADLLDESELRFVRGFEQLPRASRALAVRMITRDGCIQIRNCRSTISSPFSPNPGCCSCCTCRAALHQPPALAKFRADSPLSQWREYLNPCRVP